MREPDQARFRHEALLYESPEAFVVHVSDFVRAGLAAGEPVDLAVTAEHAALLCGALGAQAAERVAFLPTDDVGHNPARFVPLWHDRVQAHRGVRFRAVGEVVRSRQAEAQDRACRVHEFLTNAAFDAGPGWTLLCPHDLGRLSAPMVEAIARSHPHVSGARLPAGAPAFDPLGAGTAFEEPLPDLGPPLFETEFGLADLPRLRAAIRGREDVLGLHDEDLADFVLVADELACNSVQHGGGTGRMSLWTHRGHAVCEVSDQGLFADPLAGRRHPDLRAGGPGAGLWSANRICDLVLIRFAPAEGTTVRGYLDAR